MSKATIFGAIIIVIIVAAGVAAFYLWDVHISITSTKGNLSIGNNNNGGVNTPLITESQAPTLFGSSGTYNESNTTDPALFFNLSTPLQQSISDLWIMAYTVNASGSSIGSVAAEFVFQSSNAKGLYAYLVQNATTGNSTNYTATETNQTYNGLEYTYISSNVIINSTVLVGQLNNYVAEVLVLGPSVDQTNLLSAVESDLS